MEKFDHLIIDTNLLYYRNYATHENLTYEVNGKRLVTGGVYGSLISIKKLVREKLKTDGTVWCLFDNATSKQNMRQKMIDPTYKVSRKKRSEPFYRSLEYLRLILLNFGSNINVVYGTGFEADDLVPNTLAMIHRQDSVLMVSEDLDWARLIEHNKRPIYLFMKKKIYTAKIFNEKYNFFPTNEKITLYKTIKGDKSDDIPVGVPNIPTKKVITLIENFKDIYDLLDNVEYTDLISDKWKKEIIANKARLRLNYQLVSFFPISQKYFKQFIFTSKFRPHYLKKIYESLGFNIRNIDVRVYEYLIKQGKKEKKYKNKDDFFREPKIRRK